jgi:hypothetical protein
MKMNFITKAILIKILIGTLGVIIAVLQGIQVEDTGKLVATDKQLVAEVKTIQQHQADDLDKILKVMDTMEFNQIENLKAQKEFNERPAK